MKRKAIAIATATALGVSALTGCMGQMATTGMVSKFNLMAVDNRYGREGLFLLLSPVYAITSFIDLFIVNAIEFWTGTNPITKKSPAVVDTPAETLLKVDDQLDDSLKGAPMSSIEHIDVESTTIKQISDDTLQMDIYYVDGTHKVLRGVRSAGNLALYLDGEYLTTVSRQQLLGYQLKQAQQQLAGL